MSDRSAGARKVLRKGADINPLAAFNLERGPVRTDLEDLVTADRDLARRSLSIQPLPGSRYSRSP